MPGEVSTDEAAAAGRDLGTAAVRDDMSVPASDEGLIFGRKPGALGAGVRVIVQETPVVFAAFLAVAVARGLVPATAMVLTGRAVDAVPGALAAGGLHGAGRPLATALVAIIAVYGFDRVAERLLFPLEEGWAHTLYGRVEQRAMKALVRPPLTDHFLDAEIQRTADLAVRQEWPNIISFSTSLLRVATWLVGALAQAALVARFSVTLAVVTVLAWLAVGAWVRRQELIGMLTAWDLNRRPHYFRRLAMEHRSAGEVRVFGLGPWLIDRFDTGWKAGMATAWARRLATGRRIAPLIVLLVAGTSAGVALIADGAARGELSAAELAVVIGAYVGLTNLALPQDWTEPLLWGATRLPSLFELEDIAAREHQRATATVEASAEELPRHAVRFEKVTFGYPGRTRAVLDGLDLTIEAGRSLAIVGVNGAGKTTLVKLLARLHDPQAGRITVDGIDLRTIDPQGWQRRVAAIFQDFLRLPLPVAENITLTDHPKGAEPDPRLTAAATDAGAFELIGGLPRTWDTILSRRYEDGTELSGGEWQRIALARALYAVASGAGVLVLDEPTANLDARGEAELFDRFLEVTRGATAVVISHRFSTVRRADRIVVLDGGRVTEEGTHDQLMSIRGRYAELFELQASRYHAPRDESGLPT